MENIDEELLILIRQGLTLNAIKIYKEFSGLGLKESKDYIDNLISNHF